MMDLSQLKRLRMQLNLTQSAFAKSANLSQSLIAKIESGQLDPKYSSVKRIEETLARLQKPHAVLLGTIMHVGIIAASPHETVAHLVKRMQHAGISQVPVMDGKHPVGLVSESTIIACLSQEQPLHALAVNDIMEDAPPVLSAATPVAIATSVLEHAPLILVQQKTNPVGVVTRADIIRSAR